MNTSIFNSYRYQIIQRLMINNLDHNIVKNLDIKRLNFLYLFVMGLTNSVDNKLENIK